MRTKFTRFIGIDLGGSRGKSTAVARLSLYLGGASNQPRTVQVDEILLRAPAHKPWSDASLLEHLGTADESTLVAIAAPLTQPACIRCVQPACPGVSACVDPATIWLRTEGEQMVQRALASDQNRIAAVPAGNVMVHSAHAAPSVPLLPYVHRCTDVTGYFEKNLISRDQLTQPTSLITARAVHLRKQLTRQGFHWQRNLIEVSPRATVHALFGEAKAKGYKRDADPWFTRAAIVEALRDDLRFSLQSRMAKDEVLRNDHGFDSLLAGFSGFLWARDDGTVPDAPFAEDGWTYFPPSR